MPEEWDTRNHNPTRRSISVQPKSHCMVDLCTQFKDNCCS